MNASGAVGATEPSTEHPIPPPRRQEPAPAATIAGDIAECPAPAQGDPWGACDAFDGTFEEDIFGYGVTITVAGFVAFITGILAAGGLPECGDVFPGRDFPAARAADSRLSAQPGSARRLS